MPILAGSGNVGAAEGAEVAASWIDAQIGQSRSADPFDLWIGSCVLRKVALELSAKAVGADFAEASPNSSVWMWPNDSTIWIASANSAKREPKRMFNRNQDFSTRSRLPLGKHSTAGGPVLTIMLRLRHGALSSI
jgi:hypothetical protein